MSCIMDKRLEGLIRMALKKEDGELTRDDLERLEVLECPQTVILTDLRGLEFCVNLRVLQLSCDARYAGCTGDFLEDISPLAGLKKLMVLRAANHHIRDISPLERLTGLVELDLTCNQIEDLTPLEHLGGLTDLRLDFNRIINPIPLRGLEDLQSLRLMGNPLKNAHVLSSMTNLKSLSISDQDLSILPCPEKLKRLCYTIGQADGDTMRAVGRLTSLAYLSLMTLSIESLCGLEHLTRLEELYLGAKRLPDDISPLSGMQALRVLSISGSEDEGLDNIDALSQLYSLEELCLWHNRIRDVSPLKKLTRLTNLNLSYNQIEDISPLAGLTALRYLYLAHNRIADFSAVENLPGLLCLGKTNNL